MDIERRDGARVATFVGPARSTPSRTPDGRHRPRPFNRGRGIVPLRGGRRGIVVAMPHTSAALLLLSCLILACGDSGAGTASATGSTGAGATTSTGTGDSTGGSTASSVPTTGASAGTGTGAVSTSTGAVDPTTGAVDPTTSSTGDVSTTDATTSGSTSGSTSSSTSAASSSGGPDTTTNGGDPPPAPTMPAGCQGACECCEPWPISWSAVPGATHYVVRWKCSINPEQVHDVGANTSVADVCNDIEMCNGMCAFTVGYIKVQACNDDGCSALVNIPADEVPITCGGGCCC